MVRPTMLGEGCWPLVEQLFQHDRLGFEETQKRKIIVKAYSCQFCEFVVARKRSLENHMQRVPFGNKGVAVHHCDYACEPIEKTTADDVSQSLVVELAIEAAPVKIISIDSQFPGALKCMLSQGRAASIHGPYQNGQQKKWNMIQW